jgi:hypothetical protein
MWKGSAEDGVIAVKKLVSKSFPSSAVKKIHNRKLRTFPSVLPSVIYVDVVEGKR